MILINAHNKIIGRISTVAAKQALLGEEVAILNCEAAVLTGARESVLKEEVRRREQGTFKGPFIPRMPDRYVRRVIRGMLPYKQEKGRQAYNRIKCYLGVPAEFAGKETLDVTHADISKLTNLKYVTVKDICQKFGRDLS